MLLLSSATAHPKPRWRETSKSLDWDRFRCPTGRYMEPGGGGPPVDRTPRLHRHLRQGLARGLVPSLLDAPTRFAPNGSTFHTHESAAWPKPQRCRARRKQVCQANPHFCLILPQGNAPRTSLVSDRHRIEFRQVWKVASSSLASFFYCNMWGDLRAEKLLPGQPPPPADKRNRRLVVVPTREPISRFIASSFEVLERLVNHVSPGGSRMPDDMYAEPAGPLSHTVLSATTSWFKPLLLLTNLTGLEREVQLRALVTGFLEDIECAIVYSAAEHLATQMSFITSGYSERAVLDFQIKIPNVTQDLERLGHMIKYRPQTNHSVWKCPLGRENDGATKAKFHVNKQDFLNVLANHPSLVQRLCTVYIQDYLCLGFALPAECEGGRELGWLDGPTHGRGRHPERVDLH
ncbi:hypothetical protein AB1Y20_001557 [Prymnesium parvum]|uniref:Uncharacterized protein n=1 Tax=Prymnesium parvum TaxID=97485 RepID=A0AB34KBQ4_PRYPA|mmetsp:Transcript_31525/g.76684  ORF Transcript_31525/g.76684 Transcript_31525/m.76684 type:complete len:405 (+) Transcript_31525:75-1289(+)